MNATTLKRFFRETFNIPVRVKTSPGKGQWIGVWIPSDKTDDRSLRYSHHFPAELGNKCMRIVYPNSEKLREQDWGGNISQHSISMVRSEWEQLLAVYGWSDSSKSSMKNCEHKNITIIGNEETGVRSICCGDCGVPMKRHVEAGEYVYEEDKRQ